MEQSNKNKEKDGVQFSFKGDLEILKYLNLKLDLTLIIQKPYILSVNLKPVQTQTNFDYLINLEAFSESQKDYYIKSKSQLKDNVIYMYFPAPVRVDDKIYKIYSSSYETFIKEIPKQFRNNFCKLIIYENGQGEHSIEAQRFKCNQIINNIFKTSIEKRIELNLSEIASLQNQNISVKVLLNQFVAKNKLAYIYKQLKLSNMSAQVLTSLWYDLLYNYKVYLAEYRKSHNQNEFTFKPPFVIKNINEIIKNFQFLNQYLRIVTFAFIKMFESQVLQMQEFEAVKKLKQFLDFTLANILNSLQKSEQDVYQNIWIISIIDATFDILSKYGRIYPTLLNSSKEEEYSLMMVNIYKFYRNSVEKIGTIMYGLNNFVVFPRNLNFELQTCIKKLKDVLFSNGIEEKQDKYLKEFEKTEINLSFTYENLDESVLLLTSDFNSFKIVYLKALANIYEAFNKSAFKKVGWSLKLSVLKAIVTYFDLSINCDETEIKSKYLSGIIEKPQINTEQITAAIQSILKKIAKIVLYEEQDNYLNDPLFKKSVKYDAQKDNFLNRNLEDEQRWGSLNVVYDLYRFSLLAAARQQQIKNENHRIEDIGIHAYKQKVNFKKDHILNLLLNQSIVQQKEKWKELVRIIKEVCRLEKLNIDEHHHQCKLRLGIITQSELIKTKKSELLKIKLNNKKVSPIAELVKQNPDQFEFLLKVDDKNGKQLTLKLFLAQTQADSKEDLCFYFAIQHSTAIIFKIKQLNISICNQIDLTYVNKEYEIYEMQKLEALQHSHHQSQNKKKVRKYSSVEEKNKEIQFNTLQKASNIFHANLSEIKLNTALLQQKKNYKISQISNKQKSYDLILYPGFWTPVQFCIYFQQPRFISEQVLSLSLQKIMVNSSDIQQIGSTVMIDNKWYDIINKSEFTAVAIDLCLQKPYVQIIIMVKCKSNSPPTSNSRSLQYRIRKNSQMFKSFYSSNQSQCKNCKLELILELKQLSYAYRLCESVDFIRSKAIEVSYSYHQDLEEYSIKNVSEFSIRMKLEEELQLDPTEQIKIAQSKVLMEIVSGNSQIPNLQNPTYCIPVDLNYFIKKELLKPQFLQTCELDLVCQEFNQVKQTSYKLFKKIEITSNQIGLITFVESGKGFEIIGKIEGEIQYTQGNIIDMFLMPTKIGPLVLPSIIINGKKGVWKSSIYINIVG